MVWNNTQIGTDMITIEKKKKYLLHVSYFNAKPSTLY